MTELFDSHQVPPSRPSLGGTSGTWTKRVLVDVSHAIEQLALGMHRDEPMLVVALFQRQSYFDREVEVYRQIAALGGPTVVAIVADLPPRLPPGIAHALLGEQEDLAREWSVTVLTPRRGAVLVATDCHDVHPDSSRLDSGRLFTGTWSFLREDAYTQAVRLRAALGGRVDPETLRAWDAVLRAAATTTGSLSETASDRAVRHLAERVAAGHDRIFTLEGAAEEAATPRNARTRLPDPAYLDRWLAGSAPGSIQLGVLMLHFPRLGGIRQQLGLRADVSARALVANRVTARVRGADRAAGVGEEDVVIVLPGHRGADLRTLHQALFADLRDASRFYPFVDLSASAAATVTADRPLPLAELSHRAATTPPAEPTLQLA